VYRNLQILQESGRLANVYADPLVMHYDKRLDPHYHVRCLRCGAVRDVELEYNIELDKKTGLLSGWDIKSHSIAFDGICSDCKPV
jgi:Fe2+ or Zn2+ uptake regulation protein